MGSGGRLYEYDNGTIEPRLQATLKKMANNDQPLSHRISSSSISTMIPTPGMRQSGCRNSAVSCSADNSGIMTNVAGTAGDLLQTVNRPSAADGPILNGYRPAGVALGSGGNCIMPSVGMPRQSSQMIPTPGLNNSKPMSMNSDFSNGGGYPGVQSTMVSHQQKQRPHVPSQNSRILHSVGSQIGVGVRSSLQHKPSPYGFPNGVMANGFGLSSNSMQLMNGPAASEGYLSTASYASSPQQHFDQPHQPIISTSLSQQMLPMPVDGFAMDTADLSVSGNLYGPVSSIISTVNNQNVNVTGLHSKLQSNHALLAHHATLQSMQQTPHTKSQIFDHSQKMNFQSPLSAQEHLLQSQHQIRNFQHQQFQQQTNQPYARIVQNHHHHHQQQSRQYQHLTQKTDALKHSSAASILEGQLIPGQPIDSQNVSLLTQASEGVHVSELGQYQRSTSNSDHSKGAETYARLAGSQDFQSSFSPGSQQMLLTHQQATESQNELSCLLSVSQPEALQQSHWCPQPLQRAQMLDQLAFEQKHIQEEFHQRTTEPGEAQQSHFASEDCTTSYAATTKDIIVPRTSSAGAFGLGNDSNEQNYLRQRRWILFLYHARYCRAPKGACQEPRCIIAQELVMHIDRCTSEMCEFPRCHDSKKVLNHFHTCKAPDCPVCVPVRDFMAKARKARALAPSNTNVANQMNDPGRTSNAAGADTMMYEASAFSNEASDNPQSSSKRMKVQHNINPFVSKKDSSPGHVSAVNQNCPPQEAQTLRCQQADIAMAVKLEVNEVALGSSVSSGIQNPHMFASKIDDDKQNVCAASPDVELIVPNEFSGQTKQEAMLVERGNDQAKMEVKQEVHAQPTDPVAVSKSGKPKIKGVSLTELFTPEQVRAHITGLRQWVGQSKAKAEKNQAMERSMSENSCQLCAVEKLTFEPPPIYCTPCGARIKRNAMYHTTGSGDTRHYFCIPCYNEARGDFIEADGTQIPKTRLEKKKNDEETEEWWVQCDKCEAWQHQICALFNGRRNDGGQAEYTCPNCYIDEVEKGERKPLPQSAVLGAKDLPRTILSDHIEQRLFRRLQQERQERARHLGKNFNEVPGAEPLVVRVVSSVDKKLDVKQRFLEIFQEENYPTEFPYKSKVILLFQKIEGVEVCLFGMYVQEFGSECQFPNKRRVYLSYLDSVKYFRPETKTVTGEALRTFVYHEILIGYLEYCKKRGFTSCYIWACPPLKGEDYILYCHPEIQKTPKSDKLREWYLSMLRKAAKENVVVDLTNLYDHFFVTTGESKAKVTAARLPYFDGDYWPGAAEDMINQLRQEEDGRKLLKKGKTKKFLTKRALKAAGHTDLTGNASKDALLMQKLGETIYPMKEDFIMVHLQHSCTHCCLLMVSGTRWVCNQCKNFQLCDKCHSTEQKLEERERHPVNSKEKHVLCPVEINDVPSDTKDRDEILESEFFDTRQAFLSLCQGNHYQYDTLRRAKHSSMMVLYHLHNPTAPAFVTTCNVCHHDIETGQGWRCETCPDFDVCNACYQKDGGVDHLHKLTNHPSTADRDAQNQEARQQRVLQLRKMLDLLVHASNCRYPHCQYPNCRKVKGLFRHGMNCKTRAAGGCVLCKKMWYILQLHARACKEPGCNVPRCKDLKIHLRRMQQQSDSRRRAAVMEMMRQRAAEVAGNAG